jgi:hypothetical protein
MDKAQAVQIMIIWTKNSVDAHTVNDADDINLLASTHNHHFTCAAVRGRVIVQRPGPKICLEPLYKRPHCCAEGLSVRTNCS